jgi:hypothetical protein
LRRFCLSTKRRDNSDLPIHEAADIAAKQRSGSEIAVGWKLDPLPPCPAALRTFARRAPIRFAILLQLLRKPHCGRRDLHLGKPQESKRQLRLPARALIGGDHSIRLSRRALMWSKRHLTPWEESPTVVETTEITRSIPQAVSEETTETVKGSLLSKLPLRLPREPPGTVKLECRACSVDEAPNKESSKGGRKRHLNSPGGVSRCDRRDNRLTIEDSPTMVVWISRREIDVVEESPEILKESPAVVGGKQRFRSRVPTVEESS